MPYNTLEKKKAHNQRYYKKWYAENGRNRSIDYLEVMVEWRKKHPEALKAYSQVRYALLRGDLIKPKNCSMCNRKVRLSAHHPNYSKPLDILWLCSSCHKLKHTT